MPYRNKNSTIRLVLVEDNPGDVQLIKEMLHELKGMQFDIRIAARLSTGLVLLSENNCDTILLDLELPDSQGIETFTKTHAAAPNIPIIVLTGLEDKAFGIKALKSGAQDYLVKGQIEGYILEKSINYANERYQLLSELKRNSLDLASSKKSFQGIVEKSADGIFVADNEGFILFANASIFSQFGLEANELIGRPFGRPIVSGDVTEIDIIRSDGTKGLAEMRVVETNWESNPAYLAMLRDVTDSKRAEEKLVRQEKLAILGKFAGIMSHEIRNPLGVIKNALEFLKVRLAENLDRKIAKHLRIGLEEIRNIDKIIEDTLGFARTQEPELIQTEPDKLIEIFLKNTPVFKTIEIERKFDKNLPFITVDSEQIQRAFLNIVENACDAMPIGGKLTIGIHKDDAMNNQPEFVILSFKDTGVGIATNYIGKIFEPLFTTKNNGTGLGLSACQNTIHAHGGSIEVQSEPGKGSTFIIKMPTASAGS